MPPRLSQDVVDHFSQFVEDIADFAAISLTCKTWRPSGVRNLHRHRILHIDPAHRWEVKHTAFRDIRPDYASYVQILELEGIMLRVRDSATITARRIYEAMLNLPNLHTLFLSNVRWDTDITKAPLPTIRTLKNLRLFALYTSPLKAVYQPLQILALAPKWTRVELRCICDNNDKPVLELADEFVIDTLLVDNRRDEGWYGVTKLLPKVVDLRHLEIVDYKPEDYQVMQRLVLDNPESLKVVIVTVSANHATDVVAASMAFLSSAVALESMILVLPLYHRFEFVDDRVPPFQSILHNRVLLDTVEHLPPKLSVLELRFTTYWADLDDELDHDLEHRLRFDWLSVAQNLSSHREIQAFVVVLQGYFCKRKHPSWTPVLTERITPYFGDFNVHYCFGHRLFFYRTCADARALRLHYPL